MASTRPFVVRFTPDQVERLQALAEAEDRSVAYIVRKAVDAYIEARASHG